MTTKYIDVPFADGGDKTLVPDAAQVDGSVSYETGYGFDYQRDPDPLIDPLTKDIERDKLNQILNDITVILKDFQDNTVPEWQEARALGAGYPKEARVQRGGVIYTSTVDANATMPPSSFWVQSPQLDATILAMAALAPIANQLIYFTGADAAAVTSLTSFGRSVIGALNASAALTDVLGITNTSDSVAGISRRATQGEVNAGSPVVAFVAPDALRNGVADLSTGLTLPSWLGGYTLKRGSFVSNSDDNIPVTFAAAFPTACYGVIAAGTTGSATENLSWSANAITRFGFNSNRENGVGGTYTFLYLAWGK